ncbi:hypothetical protein DXG01_014257 [Tephrocybe rancida]|nr:hypothetical protein DXG01_014257 [Tephrocybe rancida]
MSSLLNSATINSPSHNQIPNKILDMYHLFCLALKQEDFREVIVNGEKLFQLRENIVDLLMSSIELVTKEIVEVTHCKFPDTMKELRNSRLPFRMLRLVKMPTAPLLAPIDHLIDALKNPNSQEEIQDTYSKLQHLAIQTATWMHKLKFTLPKKGRVMEWLWRGETLKVPKESNQGNN